MFSYSKKRSSSRPPRPNGEETAATAAAVLRAARDGGEGRGHRRRKAVVLCEEEEVESVRGPRQEVGGSVDRDLGSELGLRFPSLARVCSQRLRDDGGDVPRKSFHFFAVQLPSLTLVFLPISITFEMEPVSQDEEGRRRGR